MLETSYSLCDFILRAAASPCFTGEETEAWEVALV